MTDSDAPKPDCPDCNPPEKAPPASPVKFEPKLASEGTAKYVVISPSRAAPRNRDGLMVWGPNGEADESDHIEEAVDFAVAAWEESGEPHQVIECETKRVLLRAGHNGYRVVNRAFAHPHNELGSDYVYELDGGIAPPYDILEEAIGRATAEQRVCLKKGLEPDVVIIDGKGGVHWRNGTRHEPPLPPPPKPNRF